MTTVNLFGKPGYTMFNNAILDYLMPSTTLVEWKILCLLIRKTVGWQKEIDAISLSQIMKGTGLKNRTSITLAIKSLEAKKYIIVSRMNDKKSANRYSLNYAFEIEIADDKPSNGNVLGGSNGNVLGDRSASTLNVLTKESNNIKKNSNNNKESIIEEVEDYLQEKRESKLTADLKSQLRLQMTAATYASIISPISEVSLDAGVLSIATSPTSREWLEKRYQEQLHRVMKFERLEFRGE